MANAVMAKQFWLKTLLFCVFLSVLTFMGCSQKDKPIPHQMYVWQRVWTPELAQSIQLWTQKLSVLRILSVYTQNDKAYPININWQSIPNNTPITLVVRINGASLPDVIEIATKLNQQINLAVRHNILAIEVDYDSPTSKLSNYSLWLSEFKKHFANDMQLSITTLPTWKNSKELPGLLNNLDHYVLQVHSVLSAENGLFDKNLAIKWAQQFNSLSNTPFSISLPNYWYKAQLDENHKIKVLTAEDNYDNNLSNSQQIFADPKIIHEAMLAIIKLNLDNLKSWVWFRLPTSKDEMIFSDFTIEALMSNKNKWHYEPIDVILEKIDQSNNYDLWISNNSQVEQSTLDHYLIPKNCKIKHLVDPYINILTEIKSQFPQLLKANIKKRIGWVACH